MTTDCKTIRREIDEANLDDMLSIEANEHLRSCAECRRFHDDRRTLRDLIGSLDTVGAPADFDFRLRARLAREKPANGYGSFLLTARPIAAAALVVLVAVVGLVVRNSILKTKNTDSAKTTIQPAKIDAVQSPGEAATPLATVNQNNDRARDERVAFRPRHTGLPGRTINETKRAAVSVREESLTGAPEVRPEFPAAAPVIVQVDPKAFKVSIDNGRGGARTISLPPVSFGSQRLLARENSFMPVSSSKGDW